MSIPNRQIGWRNKAILLHEISKQLERLKQVICCLDFTPIPSPCNCDTIMTIGTAMGSYGYSAGEGGIGTLNPDCRNIFQLMWYDDELILVVISDACCSEITISIDNIEYTLPYSGVGENACVYLLESSNPFTAVGETSIIKICNTECTTTTTTTCIPEGEDYGVWPAANSYTPTVGENIDFSGSTEAACDALDVVNNGGGTFNYINYDNIGPYYYYPGTCDIIEDGYYIIDAGPFYFVISIIDGVQFGAPYTCPTTTTTTTIVPKLILTYNNIANADLMIGGSSSDYTKWNTFFDLPTNGSIFTGVSVIGNVVYLIGGSGITIKASLFGGNAYGASLLSFVDQIGCIVAVNGGAFIGNTPTGCVNLTTVSLPAATTFGAWSFAYLAKLTSFSAPLLQSTGQNCFEQNLIITEYHLPELTITGNYTFFRNSQCVLFDLPKLVTAGDDTFDNSSVVATYYLPLLKTGGNNLFWSTYGPTYDLPSLETAGNAFFNGTYGSTFYLPKLKTIGDAAFKTANLSTPATIYMPALTNLGTTVHNDNVFQNISGKTITLTIPAALMTCHPGSTPDDDIVALQGVNPVSIVQV